MYFGTYFGGGVDYRIEKTMAIRLELRGFIRGRASSRASDAAPLDPEFNDSTRGGRGAVASIGLVFF